MVDVPSVELFFYWWWSVLFVGIGLTSYLTPSGGRGFSYRRLKLPSWAPRAAWLFGAVWFVIYTLQAVAAWRVRLLGTWVSGLNLVPLILFVVLQVVLALYTFAFSRSLIGAAIVIFVALVLAVVVLIQFWRLDLTAGLVLIPLVVWLAYALALGIYVALNNSNDLARTVARQQATHGGRLCNTGRTRPGTRSQSMV